MRALRVRHLFVAALAIGVVSLLPASAGAHPEELPEDTAPTSPASATRTLSGPHVLLVEDDPGVLNATRMLLKVEGYRVTTAGSLEQAHQHARSHPDLELVISDYHLSHGETGMQVISSLRQARGTPLRAILVTGDTSSAIHDLRRDASLRLASKPINADQLLGLLRELLAS